MAEGEDRRDTTWSFWFLVGLAALYLGYRLVQGILLAVRWIAGG